MTRVEQVVNRSLVHLIFLFFFFLLCISCIQKEDKIDLDGEQTVIFHLNRVDSTFYSRGVEDKEYFIDPFIFKLDSTREKHIMSYQDIKSRLVSTDSFWNRWWEEKDRANIVDYELYLFMTEHSDDAEGQLIPLENEWLLTIQLDSIDY